MPFLSKIKIDQLHTLETYKQQIMIADTELTVGNMSMEEYQNILEGIVKGVRKIEEYYGIREDEYNARKVIYRESFDEQMGYPIDALDDMFPDYNEQVHAAIKECDPYE